MPRELSQADRDRMARVKDRQRAFHRQVGSTSNAGYGRGRRRGRLVATGRRRSANYSRVTPRWLREHRKQQ